jgi:hypothetical protein
MDHKLARSAKRKHIASHAALFTAGDAQSPKSFASGSLRRRAEGSPLERASIPAPRQVSHSCGKCWHPRPIHKGPHTALSAARGAPILCKGRREGRDAFDPARSRCGGPRCHGHLIFSRDFAATRPVTPGRRAPSLPPVVALKNFIELLSSIWSFACVPTRRSGLFQLLLLFSSHLRRDLPRFLSLHHTAQRRHLGRVSCGS